MMDSQAGFADADRGFGAQRGAAPHHRPDEVPRQIDSRGGSGSALLAYAPLLCLLLVAAIAIGSAVRWILAHPEVAGWDELGYGNEVRTDLVEFIKGGWGALRDSLFVNYRFHPPGVRLLALPVALAGFPDMTSLRLLSLSGVVVAAVLIGLTARLAAGTAAGFLAAAAFLAAPATLFTAEQFWSETLLLPCLAGMLWCLAREWVSPPESPRRGNAVLLGLFVGGGALARLSFGPQVFPALVLAGGLALVLDPARRLRRLITAALAAAFVAWPFYAFSVGHYLGYARYALTEWHTNALVAAGPLDYPFRWAVFVSDWAYGPGGFLALLLGLAGLAAFAWRMRHRMPRTPPPPAIIVVAFALAMALPMVVGHFLSENQNPRFLAASIPGLAVTMATGLALGLPRLGLPIGAGLIGLQAVALAAVAVLPGPPPLAGLRAVQDRPNQSCDWRPLLDRVSGEMPRILILGRHESFNHPQVAYAFHRVNRRVAVSDVEVPKEWEPVRDKAMAAELVLALIGGEHRDTAHYGEYFRQVPGSDTSGLAYVPPAFLQRLRDELGFVDFAEVDALGPGACRALLLARRAAAP